MYFLSDKWLEDAGLSANPCQNDGYVGPDGTCVCRPGTMGELCETAEMTYTGRYQSAW